MDATTNKRIGGITSIVASVVLGFKAFFPELARELFFGTIGDGLKNMMPDSIPSYIAEYLPYLPWVLILIAGIMGLTGWYMDTTVHLSWPYLRRGLAANKKPESERTDHWTERKQIEIYVLANASSGIDPVALPVDKDPQLTRLRALKDAITRDELDATINGERPNAMSTVSLHSFEKYVAATHKQYWNEVLHRWQATQNPTKATPVPDWKICEAMDYIAAQYGNENEQDLDKKYLDPTRLLTSKARSGQIQVWGRRIFGKDDVELSPRSIEQLEWNEIQLSVQACSPSSRRPHTVSASQNATQQFTDLYVNESQIRDTRWRDENRIAEAPPRITLIDLLREAEIQGWRFTDYGSQHVFDLVHALRDAGSTEEVQFWGREKKIHDSVTRRQALGKIDAKYWLEFQIDGMSCLECSGGDATGIASDNFQTKTQDDANQAKRRLYVDIQLDRTQAIKWLAHNEPG